LWFALRSSVNPLGTYMYALGKSRAALYYQLAFAALVAVAAWVGSVHGPITLSLGMAAVYLVFIEVAWVAVLRPSSAVRFVEYHRQILAPGIPVIAAAIVVLLVRTYAGGAFLERTALSVAGGGTVFLILSFVLNRQGVDEIIGLVRSRTRMQTA
jgi:O-antigen/teichoic acid export membrane protein